MRNYLNLTLGELLSHANAIIKRNAISILKQLQRSAPKVDCGCRKNEFTCLEHYQKSKEKCDLCYKGNCDHSCHSKNDDLIACENHSHYETNCKECKKIN